LLLVFAWVLSVGCGRPSNARKAAELPAIEAGPAPEPSDLPLVRPALVAACSVAAEAPRLRAASWNMRAARSASLDAVAEVIAQIDPDVIALQEVDVGVLRTGRVDQPALLAQRLGYHHAFAASIEYQGGVYGLAVLSRVPFRFESIERWLHTPAPTLGRDNEPVLRTLLGLSPEVLRELEAQGVIGTRPAKV
jgi:crotonobetainyl-CoA:carnitine CoA-transferase CaiB-like acyl-CoA transferase